MNLAILYHEKKDFQKALDCLDKAGKINDQGNRLHFIKANVLTSQKKYTKARVEYKQRNLLIPELRESLIANLYKADPYFISSHLLLLSTYMEQNWAGLVAKEEKILLGKYPQPPLPYYLLGKYCMLTKQAKRAEKYFSKAIKNDSRLVSIHQPLGDVYYMQTENPKIDQKMKKNHLKKAINAYELYLKKYNTDTTAHFKLALFYEKIEDSKQAIKHYQTVLNSSPNEYIVLNQLAWYYADEAIDLDKALTYAQKAAELKPDNGEILDTLGWVHYKRKENKKALNFFEKAVKLTQNHPSIHYHLALTLYVEKQKKQALESLKTAFNITNAFPEAEEAKRLLKKLQ